MNLHNIFKMPMTIPQCVTPDCRSKSPIDMESIDGTIVIHPQDGDIGGKFEPKDKLFGPYSHTEYPKSISTGSTASETSSEDDDSVSDTKLDSVMVRNVVMSEHRRAEMNGEHIPEPILKENPSRFVLFPIQHQDVSADTKSHNRLSYMKHIC